MTEAQKKKIIYEYNLHISKVKEAYLTLKCVGIHQILSLLVFGLTNQIVKHWR